MSLYSTATRLILCRAHASTCKAYPTCFVLFRNHAWSAESCVLLGLQHLLCLQAAKCCAAALVKMGRALLVAAAMAVCMSGGWTMSLALAGCLTSTLAFKVQLHTGTCCSNATQAVRAHPQELTCSVLGGCSSRRLSDIKNKPLVCGRAKTSHWFAVEQKQAIGLR